MLLNYTNRPYCWFPHLYIFFFTQNSEKNCVKIVFSLRYCSSAGVKNISQITADNDTSFHSFFYLKNKIG